MKKVISALLFTLFVFSVAAQKMKVESMALMPMDMSAAVNQRKDLNGKECALIKVSMTVSNATFGGSIIGDVQRDGSDYWVYVTPGTKMLQIKHPNYKSLMVMFPDYGIARVEGKRTYLLDINLPAPTYYVPQSESKEIAAPAPQEKKISSAPVAATETPRQPRQFKPRKIKNSIDAFFPLYGITLGKTTYADAQKLGYERDNDEIGIKYDLLKIQDVTFWTRYGNKNDNSYNKLTIYKIPKQWADAFGMELSLSYNEWLALFESLGFRIDIEKEPVVTEYNGRDILQANVRATAPDGKLYFTLEFDCGDEGCSVDSPNTLYWAGLEMHYAENKAIASAVARTKNASKDFRPSSSIDALFPVYGITLGKTTWYDMAKAGHLVTINEEGNCFCTTLGLQFSDFDKKGYFDGLYITHSENMPSDWIKLGFQWGNSYDTWMQLLEDMGYTVIVEKQPSVGKYSGRDVLDAKLRAISSDARLRMELNFNYGESGSTTSSPGTLYSISIDMTAQ